MSSSSRVVRSVACGLLVVLIACTRKPTTGTEGSASGGDGTGEPDVGSGETPAGEIPTDDPGTGSSGGTSSGEPSTPPDPVVIVGGADHCADAPPIALSAANPRVELVTSTVGATHDVDAPCTGDKGADVFYRFSVSKRVIVYADTFGASWDTALFLLSDACAPLTKSTTPGDAVCSATSCGTQQSQIVALLEPGSYRLGLTGRGGAQGEATIHFEWALAGSGTVAPLPKGTNTLVGKTTGAGTIDGLSPDCLAAAGENSYWWARCPSDPGGQLNASTCGGTTWESIVALQLPQSVRYTCNIDGCGLQANLTATIPAGAGLGVVSVDGQSGNDVGTYTLNVTRP